MSCLCAVSYTHLDVYKRQNVFCPVHMEGEKDWVVAYLMNDAVESFLAVSYTHLCEQKVGSILGFDL